METQRDSLSRISLVEIETAVRDFQSLYLRLRDILDSFISLRSRLSQTKYMLSDIAEIEAEEIKYSRKKEWSRVLKGVWRWKNGLYYVLRIRNASELVDFWKEEVTEYLKYLENLDINNSQYLEKLKELYLLNIILLTALIEKLLRIMRELE
jgi:predicted acetyltransferase